MEELKKYSSYTDFKQQLDANLQRQAESFVEAGYLLKIARDTEILAESGYKSVAEFAKQEYGFTKDLVSRYIGINDRFSLDGYSDQLDDRYKGYGFSKLAEMLSLPDSIIEELNNTVTREQIQEIKKEFRAEKNITDLEVLCEEPKEAAVETTSILDQVLYEYFRDKEVLYSKIKKAVKQMDTKKMRETLAPSGTNLLTARVAGKGKYIITIKTNTEEVVLTNMRTGEKEQYTIYDLFNCLLRMFAGKTYAEAYQEEKVVPVQQNPDTETSKEQEIFSQECNPEPVQMQSICYSCVRWNQCEERSTTTTECNEYIDKNVPTEEERYSKEQDKIDEETTKILQDRADEEKMSHLPSESEIVSIHEIKLAAMYYDDIMTGRKKFELRKNDRGYKVGDKLIMQEYKSGNHTGRTIKAAVTYLLEDYTGLEEGYCILGIEVEQP